LSNLENITTMVWFLRRNIYLTQSKNAQLKPKGL